MTGFESVEASDVGGERRDGLQRLIHGMKTSVV